MALQSDEQATVMMPRTHEITSTAGSQATQPEKTDSGSQTLTSHS